MPFLVPHGKHKNASARLHVPTTEILQLASQAYVFLVPPQSDSHNHMQQNEDCGQMSAWYLFSALGFYPVNPVSGEYVIGS